MACELPELKRLVWKDSIVLEKRKAGTMVDYDRLSSWLPNRWQKGYLLIRNKLIKRRR
jgi:predicted oxidoreductase